MREGKGFKRIFVNAVTIGAGITFIALGLWGLVHPWSFYDLVAPWPPFNRHFIRDSGVFQIGLGAGLILVARRPENAVTRILLAAGTGAGLHVVSHLLDRPLGGGRPQIDFPMLTLLAVALIVASAVSYFRRTQSSATETPMDRSTPRDE